MPAALRYMPNDTAIRDAASGELAARRAAAGKAWNYYDGKHKPHLKTRAGEPDDNVAVNLIKQTADREVSFLVGPEFPILELGSAEDAAEGWLRTAWADGARVLARAAKYGVVEGHAVVRVMPAPVPDGAGGNAVRLVVLSPSNFLAFWRADDVEEVLWYELHWEAGKTKCRQDIVHSETGEWMIHDWEMADSGGDWRLTTSAVWNYTLPPIIDWQHETNPRAYYGQGIESAIPLNDRVNKVMSDVVRILRYHAAPRTVGTGFKTEALVPTGIDNFLTVENAQAKIYNLEMTTDLASSMAAVNFLSGALLAERRITVLKGDAADFQRVTNLGIRTIYMDQLSKNEELRRNYAAGIQKISQIMLMIGGYAGRTPKVIWRDPLPIDPAEATGIIERQRLMGLVSAETAAKDLGRDWALEQERLGKEETTEFRAVERALRE